MSPRDNYESEPPPPPDPERARRRLESVIPDLIKKAVIGGVERGYESAESLRNFISEQKLPKEIVNALLSNIDETKNGLFRVVAKEIRNFLEAVDWQRELQKLLTTVSFEIKTEIRFIPNDATPEKLGRPEVKAGMKVKRNDIDEERRQKAKKKRRREEDEQRSAETEPPGEMTETPPPVGEVANDIHERMTMPERPPPRSDDE
jgi:hypothetical protein